MTASRTSLLRVLILAVGLAAAAPAGTASASDLIDRDARSVKLAVDADGRALVTYRARGRVWRVLAWGAVDAVSPSRSRRQVRFRLDYAGGWRVAGRPLWQTFENVCQDYDGPPLDWLVTACKAPDGSYWALQSWQRMLPNYGERATMARQAAWELRLSHWHGEIGRLEIALDWAYRRFDHLFGRFTYRGEAVYGFRATPRGVPLDTFGRNIYVDTFDSAYGRGWKRENSFLTHTGTGAFCYGFYRHGPHPPGNGVRYRATVMGPGVTPDVMWQAEAPGPYDSARDLAANEEQKKLFAGRALCKPN